MAPQGAQPKVSGPFRSTPHTVRGPTWGTIEGFGPISAHPSHGSWPHTGPQPKASGPFRHTPHTVRGPTGSSTEGASGRVYMRPRNSCRHTRHTVRGPIGSSTEGLSGRHCGPAQFWRTPHTVRGHIENSLCLVPSALRYSHLHMVGSFARIYVLLFFVGFRWQFLFCAFVC